MMGGRMQREAVATVGAKYDFRAASLRAQADSTGKLSVLMEKRLLQAILVNFAGELDQLKVGSPDPRYYDRSAFPTIN